MHVDLEVGAPYRRVEVVLVWQEIDGSQIQPEALEKKRAELETLAGALSDDPIACPVQLLLETRLPIE